ncbi:DinB family protein [Pontibacter anaerobius]|uniref:DinB family protein n=1 Tax=Pontibacter anaerobius TaxID=2993940 RepID=A0ABT3RKG2_9BACT|nr:DinB family protein [Pontibacter anaerobius]MCX2742050.1 DinB family protein [Pontibacter anaerobius]
MIAMTTPEQLSQIIKHLAETVAQEFSSLSLVDLNYKPSPDSWSMLECLEHLNRYSRYYNPALAKAIAHNTCENCVPSITYSWLGRKSLDMVRPQNMKKHKTVKHMNPNNSQLGRATIEEFLQHQQELAHLLYDAKKANLNKKAVPVEFFKLLKLRIGEALEFVTVHQERHVQQALRVKQLLAKQAAA